MKPPRLGWSLNPPRLGWSLQAASRSTGGLFAARRRLGRLLARGMGGVLARGTLNPSAASRSIWGVFFRGVRRSIGKVFPRGGRRRKPALGFGVWGLGFWVLGLGFREWGLRDGRLCLGCRVRLDFLVWRGFRVRIDCVDWRGGGDADVGGAVLLPLRHPCQPPRADDL